MRALPVLCGMSVIALASMFLSEADARTIQDSYKCEIRYEIFKSLGASKFVERYKGTSIASDCLKLYKNPAWNFVGKSAIDRHYNKIVETKAAQLQTEILEKKALGGGKYSVAYKVCAKDRQILQPTVLVSSRFEGVLAVASNPIPSNTCKVFSVPIKSPTLNEISIKYVPDIKDPALKSVKVVNLGRI